MHKEPLSVYRFSGGTAKAKGVSAHPTAKSIKKFNPKRQVFKRVFELTCGQNKG